MGKRLEAVASGFTVSKICTALAATLMMTWAPSANAGPSSAIFAYSASGSQQLIINGGTTRNAVDAGWFDQNGNGDGGTSYIANYLAGICGSSDSCFGTNLAYHNFFVFDLGGLANITSASLSIGNGTSGYISPAAQLLYSSWDVSTPIAELLPLGLGLPKSIAAFDDLGSGVSYATTLVSAADDGTQIMINFNAAALTDMNTSAANCLPRVPCLFAIGGSVTDLPEPATLALFGTGLAGAVAMRRRKKEAA